MCVLAVLSTQTDRYDRGRHGRDRSRFDATREVAAQAEREASHELVKRDTDDTQRLKVSADLN